MLHSRMVVVAKSVVRVCLLCLTLLPAAACAPSTSLQVLNASLTAREFTGDLNSTKSMAVVSGVARNGGDEPISDCRVTVTFYDENGNSLGSSEASQQSLGPGESWSFAAQLTSPDAWKARSYKLVAANR